MASVDLAAEALPDHAGAQSTGEIIPATLGAHQLVEHGIEGHELLGELLAHAAPFTLRLGLLALCSGPRPSVERTRELFQARPLVGGYGRRGSGGAPFSLNDLFQPEQVQRAVFA